MKSLLVVLVIVSCPLLFPGEVLAQHEEEGGWGSACYPFDPFCNVGSEAGDELELGPVGDVKAEPTFFHTKCLLCIEWETCHENCIPDEEEQDVQQAYREASTAIDSGDVFALVRLAPLLRDYMSWNADRGAIQLRGCDGSYISRSLVLKSGSATVTQLVDALE